MSAAVTMISVLFSVLAPQRTWCPTTEPLNFSVKDKDATLELTDFTGKVIAPKGSADVAAGASVDIKTVFPQTANPGTYVLYALPKGTAATTGAPKDFLGTPAVIEVIGNPAAQNQSAMVTHVSPLQYAVMTTEAGPMTEIFYYDVAPHTVENFLDLSEGGYYDGLVFHRIVSGFVIQGGDPLGLVKGFEGGGSPGYSITDEFGSRPHSEGVLSMAHTNEPNTGGSQFFICLDYSKTQQLDQKYSAFGKVIQGMDAVKKIGNTPVVGDPETGKPASLTKINKVEVKNVTAQDDPYTDFFSGK